MMLRPSLIAKGVAAARDYDGRIAAPLIRTPRRRHTVAACSHPAPLRTDLGETLSGVSS